MAYLMNKNICLYLKYIAGEKQEEIHNSLLRDIHYFNHRMKPDTNKTDTN